MAKVSAKLPDATQRKLVVLAKAGDETAAAALLASVEPMLQKQARTFARYRDQIPDLMQMGRLGFWRAVQKFNPRRKVQFSTYVFTWAAGMMRRHITNDKTLYVPHPERWRALKIRMGTIAPTDEDARLMAAFDDGFHRLDASTYPGDSPTDPWPDYFENLDATETQEAVLRAIERISDPRERDAICWRFRIGEFRNRSIHGRENMGNTHRSTAFWLADRAIAKLKSDPELLRVLTQGNKQKKHNRRIV